MKRPLFKLDYHVDNLMYVTMLNEFSWTEWRKSGYNDINNEENHIVKQIIFID